MKGVVIAGTGSGVGKTSIATGLMSLLSERYKVQAFKAGPDFIDTMYHSAATGRPSKNLDSYMMKDEVIRNSVGYSSKDADLCVVEGVRGLYEGFSGDGDLGSTAYLAKLLGFPVILVVDARSLTRSVAAIINGFKAFDPDVRIAGVILNKVSGKQHRNKLDTVMRTYCKDVDVVGVIGKEDEKALEERYLGLKTLDGFSDEKILPLRDLVSSIDIEMVMGIAEKINVDLPTDMPYVERNTNAVAAVPYDASYCFYYSENLECLEASGVRIKRFKPTEGDLLPDADMYYLGGGYPELYADRLSSNKDYLEGLKNASDEGKPILGECGGLMTMCEEIEDKNGISHKMSGIFNAKAVMTGIRHGPTYTSAIDTEENPFFKGRSIGHEYHYSDVFVKGDAKYGYRMDRGIGIVSGMDGLVRRNSMGSYMHQHALSYKDWAAGLIDNIH